jgi:hypothetical protein
MRSINPYFPAGAPGAGLLLLRLSLAWWLVFTLSAAEAAPWRQAALLAGALAVGAGFHVRVFSTICAALAAAGFLLFEVPAGAGVQTAATAAALALAGPGAFSIDARLYGRRTIVLGSAGDF